MRFFNTLGMGLSGAWDDGDWQVVARVDFDGVGGDDLLWQNGVSGETRVWSIDGDYTGNGALDIAGLVTDWIIKGSGDFKGDGWDDLVMIHRTTGANTSYYYP